MGAAVTPIKLQTVDDSVDSQRGEFTNHAPWDLIHGLELHNCRNWKIF